VLRTSGWIYGRQIRYQINAECHMLLLFGPRKGVATNQIISGISFRDIMKLYRISASSIAI
jgi:hypothetical protein